MSALASDLPEDPSGTGDGGDAPPLVDWGIALATARRLVKAGPSVTPAEARAVVADLRLRAAAAEVHVREFTGLDARGGTSPVVVVDRPGWVQANLAGFDKVLVPLASKVAEKRKSTSTGGSTGTSMGSAMSARVAGVEAGAVLAYMAGRVLGQFDPFFSDEGASGRLLLVAPNVVHLERELDVDPTDFRMWVCLHEETHRVQFTAVPWLREHLLSQIRAFVAETELEPGALAERLRDALGSVVGSIRGESDASIVELVQTPGQRAVLDRVIGVMSLLEGHAEYVMDAVGPDVVPSVASIRGKFTKRRAGTSPVDQLVRKLLGLELKMRQYRDGATFVRAVVDAVGLEGFNMIWTSPDTLPTRAEITDPTAWVERVHAG